MISLPLKKESFIEGFLSPLSKIADNVVLSPCESGLYSICTSQIGGSVILYSEYNTEDFKDLKTNINIPDVKKFIRLISCIKGDNLTLKINDNHLLYEDDDIRFKYFLLEDGVMPRVSISLQKIKKLTFNTTFNLNNIKFSELLKGSAIATDSDKVYFFTKNGKLFAELNDYERQNINNICYLLTDEFEGTELLTPIPLSLESLRLFAGLKTTHYTVKVNTQLKIISFEYQGSENIKIQFLISGLVK
jgi:hypothetical protein